jgi:hypothetical protein
MFPGRAVNRSSVNQFQLDLPYRARKPAPPVSLVPRTKNRLSLWSEDVSVSAAVSENGEHSTINEFHFALSYHEPATPHPCLMV